MPVIITTQTGICRSYKNFDLAFLWLNNRESLLKYLFQGPDDFNRINPRGREILWPRLKDWSVFRWKEDKLESWETFIAKDLAAQNKVLWAVANKISDPVTVRPQIMGNENSIEVNLERCDKLLSQTEWMMIDIRAPELPIRMRKPSTQLKVIVKTLLLNDVTYTSETELEITMTSYEMSRALKTRQSTWRIFKYYRPALEQLGVIK